MGWIALVQRVMAWPIAEYTAHNLVLRLTLLLLLLVVVVLASGVESQLAPVHLQSLDTGASAYAAAGGGARVMCNSGPPVAGLQLLLLLLAARAAAAAAAVRQRSAGLTW